MPDISGDMMQGAGMALAVAGALALVKWLATAKAKELDSLPDAIAAIRLDLVRIMARLDRAEADIANDKAGRRAFGAVETLVSKISADIGHLSTDVQKLSERHEKGNGELWSAINRLRDGRDAA